MKLKRLSRYESFEKRAICHCEEAEGRQSNPITIRKTMRLLRRCVPRNDRQNRNSKVSILMKNGIKLSNAKTFGMLETK